jgi:hypothetical protein
VQNCQLEVNARSSVPIVRESLMLEARGSSTLFSIVNRVITEYCLCLSVFLGEEHHFCAKNPLQMNGRSPVSLLRQPLIFSSKRI